MSASVDAITDFGILMWLAGVGLLFMHITRNGAWNKMTVCWMVLLAYLYIQFEGYAFYALWMFIWVVGTRIYGQKRDSGEQLSASYSTGGAVLVKHVCYEQSERGRVQGRCTSAER